MWRCMVGGVKGFICCTVLIHLDSKAESGFQVTTMWLQNTPPAFWYVLVLAILTLPECIPWLWDDWIPSEEGISQYFRTQTFLPQSVTCYTLVLLGTTPHVLSLPICFMIFYPILFNTIFPDLFHMKHSCGIYIYLCLPVTSVWISTSVSASFSLSDSAFQIRTLCATRAQLRSWSQVLSVSRPTSDTLLTCFTSPNPIWNAPVTDGLPDAISTRAVEIRQSKPQQNLTTIVFGSVYPESSMRYQSLNWSS